MKLRQYIAKDYDRVHALHHQGLHQTGAHAGDGPWDDDLKTIETTYLNCGGDFLVGIHQDEILCMGGLFRINENTAEIRRMRVHPGFQRKGYGSKILTELLRIAKDKKYTRLILDTTTLQVAAQKLYEKHGFSETHRKREHNMMNIFYEKHL